MMLRTEIFRKYKKNEDLDKKEIDLRMELLLEPEKKETLKELAILEYNKKEYEAAKVIFKKLIELEPKNGEIYGFLGFINYELEEYDESIENFNKAISLMDDGTFVYFLLGNAYSRAGMIVEATKCYDIAIFKNLDIYNAHIDFGQKYEDMGCERRALKEYVAAYEIDPRDKKLKEKIESLREVIKK